MDLKAMVDALEARASEAIKIEQGDYYDDEGLLVCGKCGTRKQCRNELFGEMRTHMCLCKCGAEASERRRKLEELADLEYDYFTLKRSDASPQRLKAWFDRRIRKINAFKEWFEERDYPMSRKLFDEHKNVLRSICFTEAKMLDWRFDKDDKANAKISAAMQSYADNFEKFKEAGQGLCLFGTVGTGKSFYAACVAHALIDKGIPAFMTDFNWIRNKLQESFEGRQDFLDSLNEYPLLIIDDIGAEAETEFMQEIVFSVIDGRVKAGLPLIVTTNLTSDELKKPQSLKKQRVYSRILGMCLPIEVVGRDRRIRKLASEGQDIKDLLGL